LLIRSFKELDFWILLEWWLFLYYERKYEGLLFLLFWRITKRRRTIFWVMGIGLLFLLVVVMEKCNIGSFSILVKWWFVNILGEVWNSVCEGRRCFLDYRLVVIWRTSGLNSNNMDSALTSNTPNYHGFSHKLFITLIQINTPFYVYINQ